MPHMPARMFTVLHSCSLLYNTDRKKYAPPYYIIYLFIFQIFALLLPTTRSASILLFLLYHKKFMLSNSRSAEVPFLNIISYLIQFVKFRCICAFSGTRGVCSICAEGQRELICEALEEIFFKGWRSICGAIPSDRRGQPGVSGFKVNSCI